MFVLSEGWLRMLRMSDVLQAARLDRLPWIIWEAEVNAKLQYTLIPEYILTPWIEVRLSFVN